MKNKMNIKVLLSLSIALSAGYIPQQYASQDQKPTTTLIILPAIVCSAATGFITYKYQQRKLKKLKKRRDNETRKLRDETRKLRQQDNIRKHEQHDLRCKMQNMSKKIDGLEEEIKEHASHHMEHYKNRTSDAINYNHKIANCLTVNNQSLQDTSNIFMSATQNLSQRIDNLSNRMPAIMSITLAGALASQDLIIVPNEQN